MYKPYGIIPPIITPFDEEGKVNYDSLAKMSVYLVENGVHGLFPFGTTGEFYAVSDEEYVKALETVRRRSEGNDQLLRQADPVDGRLQPHHHPRRHPADPSGGAGGRL